MSYSDDGVFTKLLSYELLSTCFSSLINATHEKLQ